MSCLKDGKSAASHQANCWSFVFGREVIDARVLLLWLRTDEGRAALQACITGQTAHLHPEYVEDVTVPRRVVEGDLDKAVDLLSQALAHRRESERLAAAAATPSACSTRKSGAQGPLLSRARRLQRGRFRPSFSGSST
jgi:hypothetical protein